MSNYDKETGVYSTYNPKEYQTEYLDKVIKEIDKKKGEINGKDKDK